MAHCKHHAFALSIVSAAVLTACGGGGGGDTAAPTPQAATTLTGLAASGAALGGATITVIDSDATTTDPQPVTAGADGRYSVDVSGLKAPLIVKVSATVEGAPLTLVAVVPSVTAAAANTANVTPLTNAVAALLAPGGDPSALLAPTALAAVSAQGVANASSLIVNTLRTDATISAALGASFDPLTTAFTADGSGVDGVLDKLDVAVSAAGVAITNLAAPATANGNAAAVTLTAAQASSPTTVPTLPSTAAGGDIPSAAEIAALGAKFDACFALPLAQRVTMDSTGTVTAVAGACNFAAADFHSSGRNWVQQVGQYTFAKGYFSGAKAGKGQIVLALAAAGLSDPKEFKHPYCNSGPCVVVRYPFVTASGKTASSDWTLGKTASGWDFVGNQLPYNVYVEPRLNRDTSLNTTPAAGSGTDPYFFKSRFESRLRLGFDLGFGNTNNVRAVRFTGPGLPAAGVVEFRSQACGMSDRMGITYQNGSTRVSTNLAAFQFWTGATGMDFTLDAANLDGSPLAMPTPVLSATASQFQSYAPAPVANQSATIPAWARYKAEVFHYDNLSDTADEVIYVRTATPGENAALGVAKAWPTLAAAAVSDFLTPGGQQAGAVADTAHTLAWTGPAGGGYVGSAYVFASSFASATNSQNETATYGLRTRLDLDPAALGDLGAAGYAFADVRSGTALSTYTQTAGSNPNPRCGASALTPLTATTADYREAGLNFRGSDRKLYTAVWYWQN